jgi:carbonic anhydrase/acetyltransferase-like protein (isoleucine patch superfamily)
MKRIVIRDRTKIPPFNESARDLRVLNKPLWLHQRDVLARHCQSEVEVETSESLPPIREECIVYRDNLFFDEDFIGEFLRQAKARGKPCRVAFSPDDKAITVHALPLQEGIHRQRDLYVADLWYYPSGVIDREPEPVIVDTLAREIGYYHIPAYMASEKGDMVFWVPLRPFLSIENWVHIFMANSPFGIFSIGAKFEYEMGKFAKAAPTLLRSLVERKQLLSCSKTVKVGRNVQVDPTAVIQGPAIIGDNVTIGPGAVVTNSVIGSNVNVMQGCQVMLSVVSDGCYLPFRAALFMTTLMENSMVAQNATLQMCVVGRHSFVGANTSFTDFNLVGKPLRTLHKGKPEPVGMPVLGGCVGHNCRVGAGMVIYPARTIESDVVLICSEGRGVIADNVAFEQSDHIKIGADDLHPQKYTR